MLQSATVSILPRKINPLAPWMCKGLSVRLRELHGMLPKREGLSTMGLCYFYRKGKPFSHLLVTCSSHVGEHSCRYFAQVLPSPREHPMANPCSSIFAFCFASKTPNVPYIWLWELCERRHPRLSEPKLVANLEPRVTLPATVTAREAMLEEGWPTIGKHNAFTSEGTKFNSCSSAYRNV